MVFSPGNFESMLSGSHVAFKTLARQPLSEQERELQLGNERALRSGIWILRKLRTHVLQEQDQGACQSILKEAHEFSGQMAKVILDQALGDKPSQINPSYIEILRQLQHRYTDQDADSGYSLPPQYSIQNLFRATDDMLVRIQEKAQSFRKPDHTLAQDEVEYVLHEFLVGTNDLTINAREKFFEKDTKVGGILSGGSVYLELVKTITERYGDPSLTVNSFVIAVDKHNKRTVFEASESDLVTRTVIVTDDMVNKGGTLITALWAAGERFPNARIHSGLGTDPPGGYEKRRTEKFMGHLGMLYQDFADLSENGRNDEALTLFRQAEQYAAENNVTLQQGWYKRKARIEEQKK
jgi:hypothetical protein